METELIVRARESKKSGKTYQYRFEIPSVDGKRQWVSKSGFATKKDARSAGLAAMSEYDRSGSVVVPAEISYADFLNEWLELDCKPSFKEVTYSNYRKKINNHIIPSLGSYSLKRIRLSQLQQFLQDKHNKGYARNTLSVLKGILTKSFNYAVKMRYIVSSPALGLTLPKTEMTEVPTRSSPHAYITGEQMQLLFARFPEGSADYLPLMLGYHCGLRIGETFALTWDDIDLERRTLTVRQQIQWHQASRTEAEKRQNNGRQSSNAGSWYFSSPKYNSFRTIEMDDVLTELLRREYRKRSAAEAYFGERYIRYYENEHRFIESAPSKSEVRFVCVREDGSYVNARTMQHISRVAHEQLGIPEFDYHSLRHTHATMLMENGAPPKYVQQRLGHKSLIVTLNTYQHFTRTMQEQGVSIINNMF